MSAGPDESRVLDDHIEVASAWANTQFDIRDAAEAVMEMIDEKGCRSMGTMGSVTLCRSVLIAGLVDRSRVVVVFRCSDEAAVGTGLPLGRHAR